MPQFPVLILLLIDCANDLFEFNIVIMSSMLVSKNVAPTYFDATSEVRSDNLVKMADERAARRNRLEQRALQRRLNRNGFGKTILMSIFVGKA